MSATALSRGWSRSERVSTSSRRIFLRASTESSSWHTAGMFFPAAICSIIRPAAFTPHRSLRRLASPAGRRKNSTRHNYLLPPPRHKPWRVSAERSRRTTTPAPSSLAHKNPSLRRTRCRRSARASLDEALREAPDARPRRRGSSHLAGVDEDERLARRHAVLDLLVAAQDERLQGRLVRKVDQLGPALRI